MLKVIEKIFRGQAGAKACQNFPQELFGIRKLGAHDDQARPDAGSRWRSCGFRTSCIAPSWPTSCPSVHRVKSHLAAAGRHEHDVQRDQQLGQLQTWRPDAVVGMTRGMNKFVLCSSRGSREHAFGWTWTCLKNFSHRFGPCQLNDAMRVRSVTSKILLVSFCKVR